MFWLFSFHILISSPTGTWPQQPKTREGKPRVGVLIVPIAQPSLGQKVMYRPAALTPRFNRVEEGVDGQKKESFSKPGVLSRCRPHGWVWSRAWISACLTCPPWRWVLLGPGYLHSFQANSTRCTCTQGQVTLFLCSKPSSGSHVLKRKSLQWLPMPGVTWPPISFQPCLFPLSASHTLRR